MADMVTTKKEGVYMKDGGMGRDPKQGAVLKVFKHPPKYTITKGPERSPAMHDGGYGWKRKGK
jgi:hypothetical protein